MGGLKLDELERIEIIKRLALGNSINYISKNLKVSFKTISAIKENSIAEIEKYRDMFHELTFKNTEKRINELSNKFLSKIEEIYEEMTIDKIQKANALQQTTMIGILVDKMQLLCGKETNITKHEFNTKEEAITFLKSSREEIVEGLPLKKSVITEKHEIKQIVKR